MNLQSSGKQKDGIEDGLNKMRIEVTLRFILWIYTVQQQFSIYIHYKLATSLYIVEFSMGALTNDVIIVGGGGLEKMTRGEGGVGLKMTSLFNMISGENFKQFDVKMLVLL